ncbi:unnamed protein product [Didymodactylos carnosus]|uniref:Uncharacterized protein n=1 Tax=Didymodactylos carnosus TaxID=1234261 RepID=A0A814AME0_9BILA|nr:unnamed protein product [Didymodactylos carnosus]CAF1546638.1 unnamed protein product [Didymodactylos carnosus]CAF3695248.1 unnamed protein product [Didymodactylos carnosus]CAF4335824.1 unnamed protein product [Didymodactylos carnosus]
MVAKANKNWILELGKRPDAMSIIDPPLTLANDRLLSSLLCMTLGETIGKHFNYQPEPYLVEVLEKEMRCNRLSGLSLSWTNDVSLTLCMLISLIYERGLNLYHVYRMYKNWWMNGFMSSVGLAYSPPLPLKYKLEQFSIQLEIGKGEENMTDPQHGRDVPIAILLRLSPLAYFYYRSINDARLYTDKCVKIIYTDDNDVRDACQKYIELLCLALQGKSKNDLLCILQVENKQQDTSEILRALENVLWLLKNDENSFEYGVRKAVQKFNNDSETNEKWSNPCYPSNITLLLYMQIAGALYKIDEVPQMWLNDIYAKDLLTCLAKWVSYEGEQWCNEHGQSSTTHET